ncbi:Type II secretion system (T2SS), protein F [Amycolatopsis tolypomycina]|uniref:Type II secretion system (T2SS), protein F n=1 Tax=Amycolatopsis tolypomycina TaxID=208445 RepID=A0A1H5DGA3_9PSEU|nr:type II secretion system F family protein [Amycolatopsis tolypomycina]SED77963.1 Type II secretion system (T2SS), protein F [Amycolatopsis tolypomycina]
MNAVALLLFGGALLTWPDRPPARRFERLAGGLEPVRKKHHALSYVAAAVGGVSAGVLIGGVAGAVAGAIVTATGWWAIRRTRRPRPPAVDIAAKLRLAGTLDLLAACLHAGLPVPTALEAVAGTAPAAVRTALGSTAGLLVLGSRPDEAWASVRAVPGLDELAAAAIRTSRSGAAFATAATDLAARFRDDLATEAEERAERAGVALALPVGLCFLPAFFCLGVLPVVLGLAGRLGPLF